MAKKIKRKVKARNVKVRKVQRLVKSGPGKSRNFVKVLFGAFALVFLLGSFAFFSSGLTGNVIGSSAQNSTNIVGVYLFIWGLLMGIMFLKENK